VPVALVHDYLTQTGGAERVVLSMLKAFPAAPLHTSLYDPAETFEGFACHDVRPLSINRLKPLRANHRLALPFLAGAFGRLTVDAEVALCSSSGWAHGARATGRKVVYCHSPARWVYQLDRYAAGGAPRLSALATRRALRRWDARAAASADRYLVNSRAVRDRVAGAYGIDAEILPPAVTVGVDDPRSEPGGIEPGFWLCVSRLLAYKNVEAVVEAFAGLPGERLVVAGDGPGEAALRAARPVNVTLAGRVDDGELRWLYANCRGLVAAAYEDFGLTPLEANVFGKPAVVLRWGGFLDTVVEGLNGTFFDEPTPAAIAAAVRRAARAGWGAGDIAGHAARYGEDRFVDALRRVVEEERRQL
jgi:glycosyltransferase involved in cell wall biosynthesis